MKITTKHYNLFKKEFLRYQKLFNLDLDYSVRFHFGLKSDKYKNAYIDKDFDNGIADIYFDKKYDPKMGKDNLIDSIKRTARHEAIHLLINPIDVYGRWRWTTEEQYNTALESVTRKLDKLIK